MANRIQNIHKLRNTYFEIFSSIVFLLGIVLYLQNIESAKYVLIVGASFLTATYVLISLTKGRMPKPAGYFDTVIDRLALDTLATIVMASMLKMIGSLTFPLLEVGLVVIAFCLAFMIYNKFILKSNYGWNLVFLARILCVSCIGLYLVYV